MGIADVVPGVSGGTIAFISGIYTPLIQSLASVSHKQRLHELRRGEWLTFFKNCNGSFLLTLGGGIAVSILTLARLIDYLLHHYPVQLWAFFFVLILSSALIILKKSFVPGVKTNIAFFSGALGAFFLTTAAPSALPTTPSLYLLFLNGMIAITAMLLPGISGSYLLVIMGSYATIITALKNFEFSIIFVFALGCAAGILCFSRALAYILKHHRHLTFALLLGFIIGALPKAWPWKSAAGTLLSPAAYAAIQPSGSGAHLSSSLLFMALAVLFTWGLVRLGRLGQVDSQALQRPQT